MVLKMRHNEADSFDLPKVSVWGFNPLEGQKLKVNHSPMANPRRRRVASNVWSTLCLAVIIGLAATSVRAQPESEGGAISYPLIGAVQVAGLTLPGAEHKIAQMLRDGGFVLNPQVNILLTQALGNVVSVIGDVNTPGRYSVEAAGGHLSGMLAAAGGIGPNGGDILIVSGSRGGKPFRREIDIVKMQMSGNPSDDIELTGGDTLFVGRAPMFYIYG